MRHIYFHPITAVKLGRSRGLLCRLLRQRRVQDEAHDRGLCRCRAFAWPHAGGLSSRCLG